MKMTKTGMGSRIMIVLREQGIKREVATKELDYIYYLRIGIQLK
jgi:hypothetical protein